MSDDALTHVSEMLAERTAELRTTRRSLLQTLQQVEHLQGILAIASRDLAAERTARYHEREARAETDRVAASWQEEAERRFVEVESLRADLAARGGYAAAVPTL